MKEKILHADPSYLDRLKGFTRTDTLIAAGYYMLILIVYYIMGRVLAKTGTYYGVFVNIAFILIPVFICRGLYALGLCRNNLCRSLIVSGITGIAFLLAVTIIPGTLSHAQLFPLVKREWLTILLGGVLFVLMHYPYQMAARGMTFTQYWPLFIANAPFQFLWHLAFTALYRRYGNIFGSTLLHGCVDMSMGIFS